MDRYVSSIIESQIMFTALIDSIVAMEDFHS